MLINQSKCMLADKAFGEFFFVSSNMKFGYQSTEVKNAFGMDIIEYGVDARYPIDCAIAKFRNSEYPWKINVGFYETFFVLDGGCFIEFDDEKITLEKHDFFIIEPNKKHRSYADFADVIINCTPPFDVANVKFV